MKTSTKIQVAVTIAIGCVFIGVAIYQWYDLHQIEQGLREGGLSMILHKIYQATGKWGVAAFYMPFAIYCFWRASNIVKLSKRYEREEENNLDNE